MVISTEQRASSALEGIPDTQSKIRSTCCPAVVVAKQALLVTQRAPHICFVAPTAYPALVEDPSYQLVGGAEVQQVLLAKALVQRGYEVSMVCMNYGQVEELEVGRVRVFRTYRPDEGLPGIRFFPRIMRTWRCMRRINADIYYQMVAGTTTGVVAAFCRWTSKRSIFAVAGRANLRHLRERWFYQYGLRNVSRILVQNEAQQREIRDSIGRDSTILPGICRRITPRTDVVRDSIVWIGTIRSLKRPDRLLTLAERMPHYRFTMVGGAANDERHLYPEIENWAARLPNVRFMGFVPDEQLVDVLGTAAVLVNTSESEGFPDTFLQAWAIGIPTVAFIDCGARLDGKSVGVQVSTLEELTSQVEQLVVYEDLRARVGAMCQMYVERHHAEHIVLDLYERVFSQLLGRNLELERRSGWLE